MLPPPSDSAGARILKKMGWRLGQGIGPRVTLRQRRLQDLQATSPGQSFATAALDIPEDDEEGKRHLYAPRDTPLLVVERKDNSHGLGYKPGMGLNESAGGTGRASGANISGKMLLECYLNYLTSFDSWLWSRGLE
jgi:G patch domain-containing protein 1